MAKKIKKNVATEMACPTSAGDYKPRLHIDLEDSDVSQIKGLSVGDKVELLVCGIVKSLSQRERSDYDNPKKIRKTGEIGLENFTVEVVEDESNEFTKMAEEDD